MTRLADFVTPRPDIRRSGQQREARSALRNAVSGGSQLSKSATDSGPERPVPFHLLNRDRKGCMANGMRAGEYAAESPDWRSFRHPRPLNSPSSVTVGRHSQPHITKTEPLTGSLPVERWQVFSGGHPLPNQQSLDAAAAAIQLLHGPRIPRFNSFSRFRRRFSHVGVAGHENITLEDLRRATSYWWNLAYPSRT